MRTEMESHEANWQVGLGEVLLHLPTKLTNRLAAMAFGNPVGTHIHTPFALTSRDCQLDSNGQNVFIEPTKRGYCSTVPRPINLILNPFDGKVADSQNTTKVRANKFQIAHVPP